MGVREAKKAKLKLAVLETTLKLLKEKPFDKIKVVDICRQVGTSEVTFFKYFKKKEEVLQYFMLVWDYKRSHRLKREGFKRGIAGVYDIFRDIAETDNAVGIMVALISFIASQTEKPAAVKLEAYEKEAIVQEEIRDENEEELEAQMVRMIGEAMEDGAIREDTRMEDIIKVLSGIFYGVPLITHMTCGTDLYGDYRRALDYVFEALKIKRGAEE
jgi:AcrR family transcriptional regulator